MIVPFFGVKSTRSFGSPPFASQHNYHVVDYMNKLVRVLGYRILPFAFCENDSMDGRPLLEEVRDRSSE
jgi:hypothetical protein